MDLTGLFPFPDATTVAKKLVDEFFCCFSVPDKLHSDQGKQFESHLISSICELLQVKKSHTTPYHPQSDGLVERFNRTLTTMLATTAKGHPFKWESHLKKVCFAYNTSVHASTGHTPFFLMFGRQAQLPVDLLYKTGKTQKVTSSQYAADLKRLLRRRTTRSGPPWGLSSYCRGGCMTDVYMANHTK